MSDEIVLCSLLSMCSLSLAAAAGLYKYTKRSGGGSSTPYASLRGTPLPAPVLSKGQSPWNISWIGNPEALSVNNGELTIKIKKGQHGSDSGGSFRANPWNKMPADAVTLSYEVYFPPSLQWVKGGKLPGVCIGKKTGDCSTGGEWTTDQGSFRIMFREDGLAIGYAYMAIKGGPEKALTAQGSQYKSVTNTTARTGHDLWKKKDAGLRFKKGWNTVTMELRMNSPGKQNGSISVTINGQTKAVKDVAFREHADVKFNNVLITSFFGGGSDDWNSPIDTSIKFRNFRFDAG